MEYNYFNLKFATKVHDLIIEFSGGKSGFLNEGLLESVLSLIQNDEYYRTLEEKLTHLVYSIVMNHAFNDGNKRSSIALGAFFIAINIHLPRGMLSNFIQEMENIVVHLAEKRVNKPLLQEIISSLLYEIEYSEALRLKIQKAIS